MGAVGGPAERTPAEAIAPLFDRLQLALSCVTRAVLPGRADYPKPDPHAATFAEAVPIGRRSGFWLDVLHLYRLVEEAGSRPS